MGSPADKIRELRARCEHLSLRLDRTSRDLDKARALLRLQGAVIELLDKENEEMAGKLYGGRDQGPSN